MSRTRLRSLHVRRHRRKRRSEFRRRPFSGQARNAGPAAMPMLADYPSDYGIQAVVAAVAAVNTLFRKMGRGPS